MSAAGPRRPGPAAWFEPRHRRSGGWAFALGRLTGLGLVGYLYLHLGVLFLLTRGPEGWDRFVDLARRPFFLWLDVLLVVGLLVHGLNGVRVGLVGSGLMVNRHRALVAALTMLGALVAVVAAVRILL